MDRRTDDRKIRGRKVQRRLSEAVMNRPKRKVLAKGKLENVCLCVCGVVGGDWHIM